MRRRSTDILQNLLQHKSWKMNIDSMLEQYGITKKTLRKDVQEIEDFFYEQGLGGGIYLDDTNVLVDQAMDKDAIIEAIGSMNPYNYKMSLEERKVYIIITLLYSSDFYTMQKLADELYVTRNTIINDMKVVEKYTNQFQVSILSKSKRGIYLQYEEENIILLLIDMFHNIINEDNDENAFFSLYIKKKMHSSLNLADVMFSMNQFTRYNNILFPNDVFHEIAICLCITLARKPFYNVQGIPYLSGTDAPEDLMKQMIQFVADEFRIPVSEEQVIFIEKIIMTRGIYLPAQSINDFELYGVICHFLLEVGNEVNISLQTDDVLIRSLLAHVKSMKNWGDIKLEIAPEYTSSPEFVRLRQVADKKFYILERYLVCELNDSMKDSVVIHICAALLRNWESTANYRVIVSCPGSMATSKYLAAQIKNYFSFDIVDVMTTREIERVGGKFTDIDFIISTVPIKKSVTPVAVVNPLVTVEDVSKIQNLIFHKNTKFEFHRKTSEHFSIEDNDLFAEIYALYQNQDEKGKRHMERRLQSLLHEMSLFQKGKNYKSRLLNMMNPAYVILKNEKCSWRDSMLDLAELMMLDDCFEPEYVAEAIGNVEEYGSYIIVNRGIALAHASNKYSNTKEAIGIMVSQEGIYFDDGLFVNILFFFSPEKDTDYLDLFREIVAIGDDMEQMEKIKNAKNSKEIYSLFAEMLE